MNDDRFIYCDWCVGCCDSSAGVCHAPAKAQAIPAHGQEDRAAKEATYQADEKEKEIGLDKSYLTKGKMQ